MKTTAILSLLTMLLALTLLHCSDDEGCSTDDDCSSLGTNYRCDDSTSKCQCVPACDGLECGYDGCGGTCTPGCGSDTICEEGLCVCLPHCYANGCGDDGCGGSCGLCPGQTFACDANSLCFNFIDGAQKDVCADSEAICSTTAGCTLTPDEYLEGDFPGSVSFLVHSEESQWITVVFLFKERGDPGTATQVVWHEPGCVDYVTNENGGSTIFTDYPYIAESGPIGPGLHLIEINSDATAHYYIRALAH